MEKTNTLVKDRQHATAEMAVAAVSDDSSQPFVGRWNHLVSTTNWEKGRIIAEWRQALIDADRPARESTDEAWSRLVGFVTGQHAGRLRRVYERFGRTHEEYRGLYWSHFHAALDWDDAEMWLEGAVQSKWTVSQMRSQRWQATGAVESERPLDEEIVVAEVDEDVDPAVAREAAAQRVPEEWAEVQGPPVPEGPDFGDESQGEATAHARSDGAAAELAEDAVPLVRPFANLAELPEDLADAFEAFKLAILRHKAEGWRQVSLDDVTGALNSLKELAWAPSVD
jgi:hypothetical protein